MLLDIGSIQREVRRADRQQPDARPAAHRVAAVDREVDDRCLELIGVGDDAPRVRSKRCLDGDAGSKRLSQDVHHLGDQFVGLDRCRIERLAP